MFFLFVIFLLFLDRSSAYPYVLLTDRRPCCIKCTVPGHADVIIHYVAPDLKDHDPTWLTVTAMPVVDQTDAETKPTPLIQTNVLKQKQHRFQTSVIDRSDVTACIRANPATRENPMMFSIRPQIIPHNSKSVEKRMSFENKLQKILQSKHDGEQDQEGDDYSNRPQHYSAHSKMELEFVHMDIIATQMDLDIENIIEDFTYLKQQTKNLFSNRYQTYQAALWWPIFQLILLFIVAFIQLLYMLYFFRMKDISST